jgi:Mrp family chromosome partitioning ATPase
LDRDIISFVMTVIRARIRLLVALGAVTFVAVAVAVRLLPVKYEAAVKVFASVTDSPLASKGPMLGASSLSTLERDAIISTQEALVYSALVYNRVHEATAGDPVWNRPERSDIRQAISQLLFGQEYLDNNSRYRDFGYLGFKGAVKFQKDGDDVSFTVSYTNRSPDAAIRISEQIAKALLELNAEIESSHSIELASFLRDKVEEKKRDVERSSETISEFSRTHDFPGIDTVIASRYLESSQEQRNADAARLELAKAKIVLSDLESLVRALRRRLESAQTDGASIRADAIAQEIRTLEDSLARQASGESASTALFRSRIATLKKAIEASSADGADVVGAEAIRPALFSAEQEAERQRSVVRVSESALRQIEARLAKHEKVKARLPDDKAAFDRLLMEHQREVKMLETLTEQYVLTRLSADVPVKKLYVLEKPALTNDSLLSSKPKLFVIAEFLALMALISTLAAFEFLRGTVFTKEDLPGTLGTSFLGVVPHLRRLALGSNLAPVVHNDGVRRLSFHFSRKVRRESGRAPVVMVSSRRSMAGKTISSFAIAAGLQSRGATVCLIDYDHRAKDRNLLTSIGPKTPGVAFFANLQALLAADVGKGGDAGICVAPIVDKALSDADALGAIHGQLGRWLAEASRRFDYILLDSPPLGLTETLNLVEQADAIVICVPEGRETARAMESAMDEIDQARRKNSQVFVVLSNAELSSNLPDQADATYRYRSKAA